MRVQEVLVEDKKKRYILLNQEGFPVIPVMKYIKYLDKTGKSPNTQKTYCYSLKHFYTYLEEKEKDYKFIRLEDLVDFVGWLRSPYQSSNVTPLQQEKAKRTEKTINLTITVIVNFYDYLYRIEEVQNDIMEKLMKQVFTGGHSRYKSFLHHVNKDKPSIKNILKLKEPRKKVDIANYHHTSKNIYFRFSNPSINLEVKYVYYQQLFNDMWTIKNIFTGQNPLRRMTKFLNGKYPKLLSLLDLDIDKA